MIVLRKSEERGKGNIAWLDSKHTFSFGMYYDPQHMGFETLRVINDDIIKAGAGFQTHPHNNMEIITYVLDGALEHKDSMGNGSVIRPGEIQRMSAGTGVTHSEFNHSKTDPVHLLQIWFLPEKQGIEPSYEQKEFSHDEKRGRFKLVASRDGKDGSVKLNQDMNMSVALLDSDEKTNYQIAEDRSIWVHVARGEVEMNNQQLKAGDGAAIREEKMLEFKNGQQAEVIIFDMKPIS